MSNMYIMGLTYIDRYMGRPCVPYKIGIPKEMGKKTKS